MEPFVVTESGCHEWTGARYMSGYGRVKIGGVDYRAHRFVWACANGPIPVGMIICHSCDNPPCIKLEHLSLGTHDDNMADMVTKGRASRNKTRVYTRGVQHHNAKLSDTQIAEMIARYEEGDTSQTRLAAEYGVSQSLVSQAVRGVYRFATSDG